MDDNKTIEIATDGFFGLITTTVSILNPSLGIAAMAITPTLSEALKGWLKNLIADNKITRREYNRLAMGFDGMVDTLNYYHVNETPRTDDLLNKNDDGFCEADEIFEKMINQIKQDTDRKKAYFCGNFIGSLPYAKDLVYSNLMQYCRIISQLSYSELCLLEILNSKLNNKNVSFYDAEQYIKQHEDLVAIEILSDVLHLRNIGLIHNVPPYNLGANIDNIILSFSGKHLCKLMRLNLLDFNDIEKYWVTLKTLIKN